MFSRYTVFALCLVSFASPFAPSLRAGDPVALLPRETDVILQLDVKKLRTSEIGAKYAPTLLKLLWEHNPEMERGFQSLGLDPLKDADRVTMGVLIADIKNIKESHGIGIIEGVFDAEKIHAAFQELVKSQPKQYSISKLGDRSMYRNAFRADAPAMHAVVLDNTRVLVGTDANLLQKAAATKGDQVNISQALAGVWNRRDGKATLCGAGVIQGKLAGLNLPEEFRKLADGLQTVSLNMWAEKDLKMNLVIETGAAESAKQVQALIDLTVTLFRIASTPQPELRPLIEVFRGLKIVAQGRNVNITGTMTATHLEKMTAKAKANN